MYLNKRNYIYSIKSFHILSYFHILSTRKLNQKFIMNLILNLLFIIILY